MNNVDKIESYNNGSVWPYNYDQTYLATKHIQDLPLLIKDKLILELSEEINKSGLFFDDVDLLTEIASGLIKGNIILQGPPGTGKTSLISIICRVFNVNFDIITAVSDWTTYDTIGGLQPSVDEEGNEEICGKNGRVVESIVKCCNTILGNEKYNGPEQATWLVIDELNRSEIDKVFGDLFTAFGSDDLEHRKINLWYENDKNKQFLYIPRRFRMIGVMNNIDKNYVFDISQGLARRFSLVTILPPKIESFNKEIENCKLKITKEMPKKIDKIGDTILNEEEIKNLFNDSYFKKNEASLVKFLKYIRYEENDKYLGLKFGTAQVNDLLENIIIYMILDNYTDLSPDKKDNRIKEIIDKSFNNRIIPQLDGFNYLKLKNFYESIISDPEFNWFKYSISTLKSII